jgi:molybdenum cofactor synthesis domain-containing protein
MSNASSRKTAAMLAIGDELLSGRTDDANIQHLALWLTERGVALVEARIVGDDMQAIGNALNDLRVQYDYVFTSGGIGPTHDDITADAVAAAFGVPVVELPEAIKLIGAWYEERGEKLTRARRRMARAPQGAELISNSVSGAPGVRMENVFILAGVPVIFRGMLNAVDPLIERGTVLHSLSVTAPGLQESLLAEPLREIQAAHGGVAFGSYPVGGDIRGVSVVARSEDLALAEAGIEAASAAMRELGFEPIT